MMDKNLKLNPSLLNSGFSIKGKSAESKTEAAENAEFSAISKGKKSSKTLKSKEKKPITPESVLAKRKRKLLDQRDLRSFLTKLLSLIVLIFLIFFVAFRLVAVPNDEMKPTLRARDLQLVYRFPSQLYANEIVVYEQDGMQRPGRVIGRPGDVIEIGEDQKVKVNDSYLYEGDIYYSTPAYDSEVTYPLTLGEDEYFILSDFREGAIDSRQFGPVKKADIVGKVITVLRRSGL